MFEWFFMIADIYVYMLLMFKSMYFDVSLGFYSCYWVQQAKHHSTMKLEDQ